MTIAEGVQLVAFALLTFMIIGSAIGVVLLENIVYSGFLLGGVLVSMAGMYLLLNADFVAAAQLLVYVGAVNVLIIYAIMLVNKRESFPPLTRGWIRPVSTAAVSLGLFALLATTILSTPWTISSAPVAVNSAVTIGKHFFSDFLLPFELASVLLLIAMVGAIIIARRDFIPEQKPAAGETDVYTLPERPRELVGSAAESTPTQE
ncbi:NADH-quinone oxidoreductase subunit J [Geitlerinema sp. PCC 9228]|uniref:NADH-quinone oxidoreductase subunit J n=1 Tax=Geitlerinema sp. PCC 9228 TaxID=111611 RepID=UPI0008F9B1A3|nr:NADH-quinone oxidoreductase subunit J [Geitlerinema sp. PCC 9228]